MKKLFAIAVVSLFLLHFAGVYTYFGVRLMAIRNEMKKKMKATPDEKFEKIVLFKNDIAKVDLNAKEIELNGKMYDIAKIVIRGEQIILYVIHDEDEDGLLSFLYKIVERSSNDKKPVPLELLQFLYLVFVPISNSFNIGREESIIHFPEYIDFYQSF